MGLNFTCKGAETDKRKFLRATSYLLNWFSALQSVETIICSMSKPERLTASISSETGGVLDLQEGFLKTLKLRIHNGESEPITFSCQFFKEAESSSEDTLKGTVIFDLARTLRLGMLEITEEGGSTIPFDYTGDLDLAPLVKDAWDIEANDGKAFQFGRVNTKVLQLFRGHLNSGKTYHLRLCGQTLQIFCMYDEEYIDAILSDVKTRGDCPPKIGFGQHVISSWSPSRSLQEPASRTLRYRSKRFLRVAVAFILK